MVAFGTRMRGGIATMLSVALIVSGALLAAPAANATEGVAQIDFPTAAAETGSSGVGMLDSAASGGAAVPAGDTATNSADPALPEESEQAPAVAAPDAAGAENAEPLQSADARPEAGADAPTVLPGLTESPNVGAAPVWQPEISAALADGTPLVGGDKVYADDVIVVSGSGFDPLSHPAAGRPPVTRGDPTGNYVVFGSFAEAWRPSKGAVSSARAVADQKWAMTDATFGNLNPNYVGGVVDQRIVLGADGTFTAMLSAKAVASVPGSTPGESPQTYGVFTYVAGGGANDVAQELELRLNFSDAVRPEKPELPAGNLRIDGVSVVDTGLKVDVRATGLPGGIYAALIERGTGAILDMNNPSSYAAFAQPFPKVTNGNANFSLVAPAEKLDRTKKYEVLVWRMHSAPDESTIYGQVATNVTAALWDKLFNVIPPVVTPPEQPKPATPGAGSLTWGISTPFAGYVTGNISKGTVATSGVGGGRGGYVFPQAAGGSFNAETRTGTAYYSGNVSFIGHGGLLRETFSNPVITVNSPIAGTLTANGRSFALNLTGAGFTANPDGSATWSNAYVGGEISGGDGGGAGGGFGMDRLSFTVGAASSLSFGSTTTVSQFAKARAAATAPPSATGLTVVTQSEKLVAGGEIELTAGGFEPNEQGILVVMYSEPTVLDTNAKADKEGVVRWIGTLPKHLTGTHTITLQGSISVGQEITVAAADSVKPAKNSPTATPKLAGVGEAQSAGMISETGSTAWGWWVSALALLIVAGGSTGLVVAQRRKNGTADRL